jgi:Cdc6-like AAA superfamily ATPase
MIIFHIGSGKTATVLSCIDALKDESYAGKIPAFEFLEINCLRLSAATDACTSSHFVFDMLSKV